MKLPITLSRELLMGLTGLIAGSLITGGIVGGLSYTRIQALHIANIGLEEKITKADSRRKDLTRAQASLQQELDSFKDKRAQAYQETIDSLMQAKQNAGIESLYEIGLRALQAKDYPQAYYALSEVSKANPEYKEIAKHFPLAKKAYDAHQQKQTAEKVSSAYARGLDHQLKGQFAQAQTEFQRVLDLKPGYKDAQARLASVARYQAWLQKTRDAEQKSKWLDTTYKLALKEQSLGRFVQAQEALQRIVNEAPGYKDAARRLKLVGAKVPKTAAAPKTALASNPNCFMQGVTFGNCLKPNATDPSCKQLDLKRVPAGCSGNPEFQKGFSSVVNQNSLGQNGLNQNNLEQLKNFPNWLQNL